MPTPTEAQTRETLIDPALTRAGWDLDDPDQVRFEIPVDDVLPAAWQGLQEKVKRLQDEGVPFEVELPAGISDYALYRENGVILAIVEATRTSVDPRIAVPQAEFYVTEIEKRQSFRPFAFLTNGHDTYFGDVGHAQQHVALRQPEHLFQTLLHQAFAGEV